VFWATLALACAALAVSGLVTASLWLSLGFVGETFSARERDQFFIYQARVEHLRLVATLTSAAHGEASAQDAQQKLDVFLGRIDALRTAPVLEQLREDPKMARAVAELARVAQEIDARPAGVADDWLRARVDAATEPLRMAAEAVLAATVSRQQSRYEALIFRRGASHARPRRSGAWRRACSCRLRPWSQRPTPSTPRMQTCASCGSTPPSSGSAATRQVRSWGTRPPC
jgi:hypothetical protein